MVLSGRAGEPPVAALALDGLRDSRELGVVTAAADALALSWEPVMRENWHHQTCHNNDKPLT